MHDTSVCKLSYYSPLLLSDSLPSITCSLAYLKDIPLVAFRIGDEQFDSFVSELALY